MAKVARGKALVAKLRAQAGVRDAEALAAYLGRFKKARKAGRSVAEAQKIARGEGPKRKPAGGLAERVRNSAPPKRDANPSVLAKRDPFEDDPFAEDYGENEKKSKEDLQRERMEAKLLRRLMHNDASKKSSLTENLGSAAKCLRSPSCYFNSGYFNSAPMELAPKLK